MKQTLFEKAIRYASSAHEGQFDAAGFPYILHPLRVAVNVECPCCTGSLGKEEKWTKVVALLHDVVEDTDVTLENIRYEFGPPIADAVDAITHRPNEFNRTYLDRVRLNTIATAVKLADMTDNSDPSRLVYLPIERQLRLAKKYTRGRHYLLTGEWHE